MKKNLVKLFVIMVIVALTGACGDAASATNTSNNEPTIAVDATATPEPAKEPTVEPTPQEEPENQEATITPEEPDATKIPDEPVNTEDSEVSEFPKEMLSEYTALDIYESAYISIWIDKDGVINASFENDSVSEIFTEVTYQNGLYAFLNDNANLTLIYQDSEYNRVQYEYFDNETVWYMGLADNAVQSEVSTERKDSIFDLLDAGEVISMDDMTDEVYYDMLSRIYVSPDCHGTFVTNEMTANLDFYYKDKYNQEYYIWIDSMSEDGTIYYGKTNQFDYEVAIDVSNPDGFIILYERYESGGFVYEEVRFKSYDRPYYADINQGTYLTQSGEVVTVSVDDYDMLSVTIAPYGADYVNTQMYGLYYDRGYYVYSCITTESGLDSDAYRVYFSDDNWHLEITDISVNGYRSESFYSAEEFDDNEGYDESVEE